MLSVIIVTIDSERALVPTLAALVPGATSGLISEVIVADGGSRDDTAAVADAAGCNFRVFDGPLGRRLKTAAAAARAPWLLFLRPGTILDAAWTARGNGDSSSNHRRNTAPRYSGAARLRSRRCAMCFRCSRPRSAPGRVPSRASSSRGNSTTRSAAISMAPPIPKPTSSAASAGGGS